MTDVAERPILFSGPMVRAILAGTKTQTRRVVRLPADVDPSSLLVDRMQDGYPDGPRPVWDCDGEPNAFSTRNPFGGPGGRLWVRETWQHTSTQRSSRACVAYAADGTARVALYEDNGEGDFAHVGEPTKEPPVIGKWRPSIFMPRGASRITLEITDVRVQPLRDVSEDDARAEGALYHDGHGVGHSGWRHDGDDGVVFGTARESYFRLWDRINGKRPGCAAKDDPWVWALTFKVANG